MSRGQILESRKHFVEEVIGTAMSVKRDFGSIKYAKRGVTDGEYMRITDVFGRAVFIDITGNDLDRIFEDVCRISLIGKEKIEAPLGVIVEPDTIRSIAPLFK